MKFLNPWIDPRVVQVRPAAAQAYLVGHGWKAMPPEQPNFVPFEGPPGGDQSPLVMVPLLEQGRDYGQRMVELITEVALAEGRFAVDVLGDMLHQATIEAGMANGTNLATPPAAR